MWSNNLNIRNVVLHVLLQVYLTALWQRFY